MGSQRILVIDPDPAVRSLIVALLRRDGYVPEAAADADDALQLGKSGQHVAVVVEPRNLGDGELLDALTAAVPDAKRKLIVVTTPDIGDQPFVRRNRVRAVIFKPFCIADLREAVASCCDEVN